MTLGLARELGTRGRRTSAGPPTTTRPRRRTTTFARSGLPHRVTEYNLKADVGVRYTDSDFKVQQLAVVPPGVLAAVTKRTARLRRCRPPRGHTWANARARLGFSTTSTPRAAPPGRAAPATFKRRLSPARKAEVQGSTRAPSATRARTRSHRQRGQRVRLTWARPSAGSSTATSASRSATPSPAVDRAEDGLGPGT